jgi:hypothetical protein
MIMIFHLLFLKRRKKIENKSDQTGPYSFCNTFFWIKIFLKQNSRNEAILNSFS